MKNMYDIIKVVGKGSLPVQCCQYLQQLGFKPVLLAEPAVGLPFAQVRAQRLGILVKPLSEASLEDDIGGRATLVLSINNTYVFHKDFVKKDHVEIINYHNALLPFHKGVHAEAWTIFNQDAATGITWHYVDANIDSGEIIFQEQMILDDEIKSFQLLRNQSQLAFYSFKKIIPAILSRSVATQKQTKIPINLVHFKCDRPNNGILQLHWPPNKIWAFLRAMDYGLLKTLGVPRIEYEERSFTWEKYIRSDQRYEKCFIRDRNMYLPCGIILLGVTQIASM